jgi:hypothetical protein
VTELQVDADYLRKHYAALSDEALLDIDPTDLVPAARGFFEAELKQRQLDSPGELPTFDALQPLDEGAEVEDEFPREEGQPDWLEDGTEVYSVVARPGAVITPANNARTVLEDAGIPCHLELYEEEPEEQEQEQPTHRWRLMVPGNLNLQATSVLQRDIFNEEFEGVWRTHLEVMSDQELRAMNPHVVFCGLFDQIERVTRAYNEELSRRRLS